MKKNLRFLTAVFVVAIVASSCAYGMHTPARQGISIKNIQTNQSKKFAGGDGPAKLRYVEKVPAGTGEAKDFTSRLKSLSRKF